MPAAAVPTGRPPLRLIVGGTAREPARYQAVRPLGDARQTELWEAWDRWLGRAVVIARLRREYRGDLLARARFAHEVTVLGTLRHPNVVAALDAGEDADGLYLVLELIDGETLANRLAAGPLAVGEAIHLAVGLAAALQHAHDNGVVHRDVSPAHVVIERGTDRPLLTGFGIATSREPGAHLTGNHALAGTPEYAAPERTLGQPGGVTADVYSLGVVLFEMLAGRPPYVGPTPDATAIAHCVAPTPSAGSHVPWPLERAVLRAMDRQPSGRFRSAAEFASAIREAADPGSTGGSRAGRVRRSLPGRTSGAAAGAYVAAGSAVTYLLRVVLG